MRGIDQMVFNAKVFRDTRNKSRTVYKKDTEALKEHTDVYTDANLLIPDNSMVHNGNMQVSVVTGGTVSTAYNIKKDNPDCRIAMLNFADAKRPGGWVVEGANTQEENICRCTNLYETLTQAKCLKRYYDVNIDFGVADAESHYIEPYTDTMIYAENVAIFKDDSTYDGIDTKYVDVITSPAPCGPISNVENVLKYRIRGIIKAAYLHNVTHIVLGAWGCGAFAQEPEVVARCFSSVLNELPVFESVVFAIRDCYGETTNYSVFSEILGKDIK